MTGAAAIMKGQLTSRTVKKNKLSTASTYTVTFAKLYTSIYKVQVDST